MEPTGSHSHPQIEPTVLFQSLTICMCLEKHGTAIGGKKRRKSADPITWKMEIKRLERPIKILHPRPCFFRCTSTVRWSHARRRHEPIRQHEAVQAASSDMQRALHHTHTAHTHGQNRKTDGLGRSYQYNTWRRFRYSTKVE